MIYQKEILLPPFKRGYHLITNILKQELPELPEKGLLNIFILHTSAGLTINENYDPTGREDFEKVFNKLIPENDPIYAHTMEGSDDMPAHIKSSLVGQSLTLPVKNNRLALGTWQGIYLCEFRNRGGQRKIILTVYS